MQVLQVPGVKFGLISAAFTVLVQYVLFFWGADKFFSGYTAIPWFGMLTMAFVAGVLELKQNNGILYFPQALVAVFTVMVITEFFAAANEFVIYNLVDPDFYLTAKEIRLAKTAESFKSMSSLFKYNDTDFEENMKLVEQKDHHFYLASAGLKFVMWLLIDLIFALILASIIRKEPRASE